MAGILHYLTSKPNNGLGTDISEFLNFLRKDKLILDSKNVVVVKIKNFQNALILNSAGGVINMGALYILIGIVCVLGLLIAYIVWSLSHGDADYLPSTWKPEE